MLEPPTPAGEPFGTQGEDESKTSADFEKVCISLVERGWKIMPKRGTYPVNKKGAAPRYLNLVDPRGNRKSIRVMDENLWEKLRAAESERSQKKHEEGSDSKLSEISTELASKTDMSPETISQSVESADPLVKDEIAESEQVAKLEPSVEAASSTTISLLQDPPNTEIVETRMATELSIRDSTEAAPQFPETVENKAEIIENPPKEFQNFALSSPGLQKSIFDLGFETLLTALQSETLTPGEIIQKIQEWSMESKNLLEFVHKWQEGQQRPTLPDTSEKDKLISELQYTLKETEEKLAGMLRSLQEI